MGVQSIDAKEIRKTISALDRKQKYLLALTVCELSKRKNDPLELYRNKYHNDPKQWVTDFVDITLPEYIVKVLNAISEGHSKIAVHGPHGIGKSVIASIIVLWALSVHRDCKVPTTASAWRQLTKFLWPEIHKWNGRTSWDKVGAFPEVLKLEAHFGHSSSAFAMASSDPATMEGVHAQRVVYIFDESKTIKPGTWEAAEGAFSTPGDHLHLALSTPGSCSGTFYDICSRKKGYEKWKVIYVSPRAAIRAKRMSIEWAKEKRAQWGSRSPVYINRVWGLFAKDDNESVIPFTWVEMAVERWHKWNETQKKEGHLILGADTSGKGKDQTVFAHRYGKVITEIERYAKSRPMELAGKIKNLLGVDGVVKIDVAFGEGAGTADRLMEFDELDGRVFPIHSGNKTNRTDKSGLIEMANVRAAMYQNMRELLDPDSGEDICLPEDPLLIGDLTTPRRKTRSDGKILVESKEDIYERIQRSTDTGDAVIQAFYPCEIRKDYVVVGG